MPSCCADKVKEILSNTDGLKLGVSSLANCTDTCAAKPTYTEENIYHAYIGLAPRNNVTTGLSIFLKTFNTFSSTSLAGGLEITVITLTLGS